MIQGQGHVHQIKLSLALLKLLFTRNILHTSHTLSLIKRQHLRTKSILLKEINIKFYCPQIYISIENHITK